MGTAMIEKEAEGIVLPRYRVSRSGMGGRKPKYNKEQLEAMLKRRNTDGISLKAQCREAGIPYMSFNSALRRLGLFVSTRAGETNV